MSYGEYLSFDMRLQIGKKKMDEIEHLIEVNCWKALFWIHSLLLTQLKYLFYYSNQAKEIGYKRVDMTLNESGVGSAEIKLDDLGEHKRKWKKVDQRLKYMATAIDICYSRSLIDEEYESLKKFNSFRNKRAGHPSIREYLPNDSRVKSMCRLGMNIVKELDKKITKALWG